MRVASLMSVAALALTGCETAGVAADQTAGSTFDFIASDRIMFGNFVERRFSPSEVEAVVSQLCPDQALLSFASSLSDTTTATFRAICDKDVPPRFEGYTVTRAENGALLMTQNWTRTP